MDVPPNATQKLRKAAGSCVGPRLAAVKLPPVSDAALKAYQTQLTTNLRQVAATLVERFGREKILAEQRQRLSLLRRRRGLER